MTLASRIVYAKVELFNSEMNPDNEVARSKFVRRRRLKKSITITMADYGRAWPGFFINKNLGKSDLVLLGFNFSQNFTFCEVSNLTDFPIPYNDKFFSYQNNQLILINDNLTV